MLKLLLVLLIGLFFEAAGVVLLKKGLARIGGVESYSAGEFVRVVKDGVTNPHVVIGVFFEALFFACLLFLLSKGDVSFVWPLTALSFVMTTFAALLFLGERVSPFRWAGVVFIMIGAGLISYSEHARPKPAPTPATAETKIIAE